MSTFNALLSLNGTTPIFGNDFEAINYEIAAQLAAIMPAFGFKNQEGQIFILGELLSKRNLEEILYSDEAFADLFGWGDTIGRMDLIENRKKQKTRIKNRINSTIKIMEESEESGAYYTPLGFIPDLPNFFEVLEELFLENIFGRDKSKELQLQP